MTIAIAVFVAIVLLYFGRGYWAYMKIYRYWSSVCGQCALKAKCTTGKERRVSRWQHEEVIETLSVIVKVTVASVNLYRYV